MGFGFPSMGVITFGRMKMLCEHAWNWIPVEVAALSGTGFDCIAARFLGHEASGGC